MKILYVLIKKEFKEIVRDPVTLATAIYLPLVMLFLFGYAISLDVQNVSMGVYDQDSSQEGARLVEAFTASGYFSLEHELKSFDEVDDVLDRGETSVILVIPPDFSKKLNSQASSEVQILLDGTFSATALIISNYVRTVVEDYSQTITGEYLARQGVIVSSPISVRSRVWFNPPLKSVNYIVPGLFAVLLMAFPPMLTALAIVREKERGTIEQIFVSPITPLNFILGKIVPYGVIAFGEMLLILIAGTMWFRIPLRGSLPLLIGGSLIYVLCTVGIGVLVSTITATQLAAILLSLIVTLMPSFLFSGFLFPIASMPYVLQLYTYAFPARYFNDISRDLFLKGVGIEYLWWNALLLMLYTLVLILIASVRFKKKVA